MFSKKRFILIDAFKNTLIKNGIKYDNTIGWVALLFSVVTVLFVTTIIYEVVN